MSKAFTRFQNDDLFKLQGIIKLQKLQAQSLLHRLIDIDMLRRQMKTTLRPFKA